jgi:hypothetical protein
MLGDVLRLGGGGVFNALTVGWAGCGGVVCLQIFFPLNQVIQDFCMDLPVVTLQLQGLLLMWSSVNDTCSRRLGDEILNGISLENKTGINTLRKLIEISHKFIFF